MSKKKEFIKGEFMTAKEASERTGLKAQALGSCAYFAEKNGYCLHERVQELIEEQQVKLAPEIIDSWKHQDNENPEWVIGNDGLLYRLRAGLYVAQCYHGTDRPIDVDHDPRVSEPYSEDHGEGGDEDLCWFINILGKSLLLGCSFRDDRTEDRYDEQEEEA